MEKLQQMKVNVKEVFNKEKYSDAKMSEWFLKENTYDSHMLTDIKNVNPNKYFEIKAVKLEPLTPMFCDNIMLFSIIPAEHTEITNKKIMYKSSYCGTANTHIRQVFKDNNINIMPTSVKCKQTIKYSVGRDGDTQNGYIRNTVHKLDNIEEIKQQYYTKYNKSDTEDAYIVTYKIELADEEIHEMLPKLKTAMENTFNKLFYSFYLLDFDITQDYYNNANYGELEEYLLNNPNFSMQDANTKPNTRYVILNNKKYVGNNCLTYIDILENTRNKFYNKFICQVTSGGVNKAIGSNVYNFLYCPDKRLKETFKNENAIQSGITRLESTVMGGYLPNEKRLNKIINDLYSVADEQIFYKTPLQKQFKAITETLESNIILYNKAENKLYLTYWGNTLTGKITGTGIKMSKYNTEDKLKVLNYVKSHYSIAILNCYYVEIDKNKENMDEITFTTKLIKKENGKTQLFKNNVCFTTRPKNNKVICEEDSEENEENDSIEEDIDEKILVYTEENTQEDTEEKDDLFMQNRGLYSEELKFFLPTKKQQIKSKVLYEYLETETDKAPNLLSQKKREELIKRLEEEEIYNKETELKYKEREQKREERKEIRKQIEDKYKTLRCIEKIKDNLKENYKTKAKGSTELEINIKYNILSFRVTNNDYYIMYITYIENELLNKEIFFVPPYIKAILEKNLTKFINYGDNIYALEDTTDTILTFSGSKFGYYGTQHKKSLQIDSVNTYNLKLIDPHKTLKIENIKQEAEKLEDEENKKLLQKLTGEYKVKDCERMEILETDKNYTITHIQTIEYRKVERYIFKIAELKKLFVSNYFLEQEIKKKGLSRCVISLRTISIKTTPTKNKEMFVVI